MVLEFAAGDVAKKCQDGGDISVLATNTFLSRLLVTSVPCGPMAPPLGRPTGRGWVMLGLASGVLALDSFVETTKLAASGASEYEYFGSAVATFGDRVVVGAYWDTQGEVQAGAAYVYRADRAFNFAHVQKLRASDATAQAYFGDAVSMYEDLIVIGAPGDDSLGKRESGSAYVFREEDDRFRQFQKLTAHDADWYDRFGAAVAVSDGVVIVGAHREEQHGVQSGSVYVFRQVNNVFIQTQKFSATDIALYDHFGFSLAISGDYVIVGSYGDDDNGAYSGSAYVFHDEGNLTQVQKLTASDAGSDDYFGYSVAMSGDFIVVGAHGEDARGAASGAAYVYRNFDGVFSQIQKLKASDAELNDFFGLSVAISNTTVVVGVSYDDDLGTTSGSAVVFETTNGHAFEETHKLTASDALPGDRFGNDVAIHDNLIVVGAPFSDSGEPDAGAAYCFVTASSIVRSGGSKKKKSSDATLYVVLAVVAGACLLLLLCCVLWRSEDGDASSEFSKDEQKHEQGDVDFKAIELAHRGYDPSFDELSDT